MLGKANDADTIDFEEPISTKKFEQTGDEQDEALQNKNQVALIGFWRKDEDDSEQEYYCYHYFYVPNPCVREYARSEYGSYIHGETSKTTVSVSQVLFEGQ